MAIFDRGIRGNIQSPFQSQQDASAVPYSNPRIPSGFSGSVQSAIDYIIDALYPNYKGTVQTPASLPTSAQANDFYIVSDDGDGKAAGYVYSVIEGATSWIKRMDVDWSAEGILAEAVNRTQWMYVAKYGFTDHDAAGNALTGKYGGQRIFGGDQTAQNLTLTANKVDLSGLIQVDNTISPTLFNTMDLGQAAMKFRAGYFKSALTVDTTTLMPASLVDTTGAFSFNALNLSTTGTFASGATTVSGTLLLSSGLVTDTSGSLSFNNNNLSTSGTINSGAITASSGSKLADFTFTNGQISTASSVISFAGKNLSNVGTISSGAITTPSLTASGNVTSSTKVIAPEVDAGNVIISSATIKTTNDATPLVLQGGTGSNSSSLSLLGPTTLNSTLNVGGNSTFQGTVSLTAGPLNVANNLSLTSTGTSAAVNSGGTLTLSGTTVLVANTLAPTTDASIDVGQSAKRFKNLNLSGGITDGTNTISMANLLSLRDINTNAQAGMALFYNGTEWLPSIPDSEIDHRTLSGLLIGDAGHTQFQLLAGRAGGQLLYGGTAAGENLTLDSTSNATKGLVSTSSTFAPTTDSAIDIGTSNKQFRNIYLSGLAFGLRFDQYAGSVNYPANATAKIGRVIWDTSQNQLLVDTGTTWAKVGQQKWLSDLSFDGNTSTMTVTVSSAISDARTAIWQLADNSNGFQRIHATLTFTQTQVTITANAPLPSGSYRLIGFN